MRRFEAQYDFTLPLRRVKRGEILEVAEEIRAIEDPEHGRWVTILTVRLDGGLCEVKWDDFLRNVREIEDEVAPRFESPPRS